MAGWLAAATAHYCRTLHHALTQDGKSRAVGYKKKKRCESQAKTKPNTFLLKKWKTKKNKKLSSLFPLPPQRIPTPVPVASRPGARERVRLPASHSNTSKLSTQPPISISEIPLSASIAAPLPPPVYSSLSLSLSP